MTGSDFRCALEAAGFSQTSFAAEMGVHRSVIGRQCGLKSIAPYWYYALTGVVALKKIDELQAAIGR